jgi:hypothetical protein
MKIQEKLSLPSLKMGMPIPTNVSFLLATIRPAPADLLMLTLTRYGAKTETVALCLLTGLIMLKADNMFSSCPVDGGDEIFPNGIFEFNITKIIDHIQRNPDSITLEKVLVKDFYTGFSSVNESYMEHVEISRPTILAEISPGQYNVIDGNHRLEKAYRMGIRTIQAHRLNEHCQF